MDGKKPLFQVKTKLISSVFSSDEKLHQFFIAVQEGQKPGNEDSLIKAVTELPLAGSSAIVQFSPVILDELFRILTQTYATDEPSKAVSFLFLEIETHLESKVLKN